MALAFNYRSSIYSTTAATDYKATTDYTPAANSLLVCFVVGCSTSVVDPNAATPFDGHGASWTKLTLTANGISTTHALSIWVANAGASPTSTAGAAHWTTNRTGGVVIEFEITGWGGTSAANAVVQNPTATGTGTGVSGLTLSAAQKTGNLPMVFSVHLANEGTAPEGGWTETAGADGNFNNPATGACGHFNSSSFDTTPAPTWTTSSAWRAVGLEIRVQDTVTKTQGSVANIRATTTKTQNSVADIRKTTTKTQNSTARIQITTTRTQGSVADIRATTTKTQGATARVQITTTRTQTSVANITTSSSVQKTQTSVARIRATATKTQGSTARIQITTTRTQGSVADIRATTTRTQVSAARIQVTAPLRTQNAIARIQLVTTRTQPSVANIRGTTTRTQTSVARIFVAGAQDNWTQTLGACNFSDGIFYFPDAIQPWNSPPR